MNISESTIFRSTAYDADRVNGYHLSIVVGNGLSAWAAHVIEDGRPAALAWSHGVKALSDHRAPQHPASVSFLTLPEWSTLVPEAALAPGTEAKHLALVHGDLPNGALRDEPLHDLGARCVYVHDDGTERTVLERYAHARPLPLQALLVRGALARWERGPLVLLHRGQAQVDIAVADHGRLLLSNSYPARTTEDLLYFTLLAVERSGALPANVDLRSCGPFLSPSDRALLDRYFPDHSSAVTHQWPDTPQDPTDPVDRWFAVLEQFACV